MTRSDHTQNAGLTPVLAPSLNANLSDEHQERVARIIRRIGLMRHPRLSTASRELFVVAALCANADGEGRPEAVLVGLADPAVLAVARRLMAEAVTR